MPTSAQIALKVALREKLRDGLIAANGAINAGFAAYDSADLAIKSPEIQKLYPVLIEASRILNLYSSGITAAKAEIEELKPSDPPPVNRAPVFNPPAKIEKAPGQQYMVGDLVDPLQWASDPDSDPIKLVVTAQIGVKSAVDPTPLTGPVVELVDDRYLKILQAGRLFVTCGPDDGKA